MRLGKLTAGDIRFQWKYGFYGVYAVFTAVYLLILAAVPGRARPVVAAALIFSDPAAMGLFFMGAIVLLEKSQRVNCAIAVSPVGMGEYCAAKLLSLALVGLLVAGVLAVAGGLSNLVSCFAGVLFSSFLCSCCGLLAAMQSRTLNQFVIFSIPFELVLCLPPVALLFGVDSPWLMLHPGAAAVWLIYGDAPSAALCVVSLLLWCVPAYLLCVKQTRRSLQETGGEEK